MCLLHTCPSLCLLPLQIDQAVKPKYLEGQEITGNMRAILIDWLVQVQIKFRLLQETMFMTVGIIDRFLQVISQWQLSLAQLHPDLKLFKVWWEFIFTFFFFFPNF